MHLLNIKMSSGLSKNCVRPDDKNSLRWSRLLPPTSGVSVMEGSKSTLTSLFPDFDRQFHNKQVLLDPS
jgi:hypothetical protein